MSSFWSRWLPWARPALIDAAGELAARARNCARALTCDGLTAVDAPLLQVLDAPVVVGAFGKKHAMAIGQVKMTKGDILEKNKGICVDNLHFLNDGLWQLKNGQLD